MKLTKARLKQIIKEEVAAETEEADLLQNFGTEMVTQADQAAIETERSKNISSGDTLENSPRAERGMLLQIEKALTSVAEKDDLIKHRSVIKNILQRLLAMAG